jgi:hypothetical protein
VKIFGRDALLAQKPNDDTLVVLHPLSQKPSTDGPRDKNSKRTVDVMPQLFSLSGCAVGTISPVR